MTDEKNIPHDDTQEAEKDYQADQSNGKQASDPSAARYTGAHGYTQRTDQKDQLENLHIGGDETHPQGGNTAKTNEQQQGPGFTAEGSYELDHQLRTKEQPFGADAPGEGAEPQPAE